MKDANRNTGSTPISRRSRSVASMSPASFESAVVVCENPIVGMIQRSCRLSIAGLRVALTSPAGICSTAALLGSLCHDYPVTDVVGSSKSPRFALIWRGWRQGVRRASGLRVVQQALSSTPS